MRRNNTDAPAAVLLLADNLDAALAASEDMLRLKLSCPLAAGDADHDPAQRCERERGEVNIARETEMALVARLLKARESALELGKSDGSIQPVVKLFASGTVPLVDAVEDLRDGMLHMFESGDGMLPYLRSRGLLADDAAALPLEGAISVTETYLVLGRLPLGVIMDLVATLLDVLEAHYPLYSEPASGAEDTDGAANETRPAL